MAVDCCASGYREEAHDGVARGVVYAGGVALCREGFN